MATEPFTVIDSHIHLYAASHLAQLNWTADLPPTHILNRQKSIDQYRVATGTTNPDRPSNLKGFIFLETDRKSSLAPSGWEGALDELAYLVRIAQGRPYENEGHSTSDSGLVLGIVPWAPVPAGPAALKTYLARARQICGHDQRMMGLVKGFRYLVQDKPRGTMLGDDFINGLRWLGERGYSFDLGVDLRQGGTWQLREASEMMRAVYGGGGITNGLKIVVNHFCKPDLRMDLEGSSPEENETFVAWAQCVRDFARYPTTYMKLSGLFSEMAPQTEADPVPISWLVERCRPWVEVVLAAFGPSRVMFGSDWPVCEAGGPGSRAWRHWVQLVTALLDAMNLSEAEKRMVWSGTAVEAYRIALPYESTNDR